MNAHTRSTKRITRLAAVAAPVVRRTAPVARPIGPVIPADLAEDFLNGRLSQRCPDCGITEAAGFYSTCHERKTGPADWFRPVASEANQAALAAARAKRHATAIRGSELRKSAPPAPLTADTESA